MQPLLQHTMYTCVPFNKTTHLRINNRLLITLCKVYLISSVTTIFPILETQPTDSHKIFNGGDMKKIDKKFK